ncbi:hypothetical protein Vca1114GL_00949 [Vibrio campbellii]|nr:hypothetical protein Vca1114GL_00949 [Vibrio campbellii]
MKVIVLDKHAKNIFLIKSALEKICKGNYEIQMAKSISHAKDLISRIQFEVFFLIWINLILKVFTL